MATFYLFVVIAIMQFVNDVSLNVPYFQADSTLLMDAKYRINADSISEIQTKKKVEGVCLLTPLSDYRLISGLQILSDINS